MTPLFSSWPAAKFSDEVSWVGWGSPPGQSEMNPLPLVFVTATLRETARAVLGTPQKPATGKTRGVC